MKKTTISLFLVLTIVFSFVGCGTTASEETATTTEHITMSHEDQVAEVVQWTIANIISQNSASRFVEAHLYRDVKRQVEDYIDSLPNYLVPADFSIESVSPDLFKIEISF